MQNNSSLCRWCSELSTWGVSLSGLRTHTAMKELCWPISTPDLVVCDPDILPVCSAQMPLPAFAPSARLLLVHATHTPALLLTAAAATCWLLGHSPVESLASTSMSELHEVMAQGSSSPMAAAAARLTPHLVCMHPPKMHLVRNSARSCTI